MPALAVFCAFLAAFLSSLALLFALFSCSRWRFACVCGLRFAKMTVPFTKMARDDRRSDRHDAKVAAT